MPYTNQQIQEATNLFKALGDATRLSILIFLLNGEASVNNISEHLTLSQSAVSHQLKLLTLNRLVERTKTGKYVYYRLVDDHVKAILQTTLVHVKENKT